MKKIILMLPFLILISSCSKSLMDTKLSESNYKEVLKEINASKDIPEETKLMVSLSMPRNVKDMVGKTPNELIALANAEAAEILNKKKKNK